MWIKNGKDKRKSKKKFFEFSFDFKSKVKKGIQNLPNK